MVKTGDEPQLTAYMSLHDSLLRRSVVPVKFLLVSFNLSDEHETYNALWCGLGDEARCVPRSTTSDHGTVWARTRETH